MREKRGDDALNELLEALVEYTEKHFAHEELNMDKYNYPEKEEHIQAHSLLKQRIVEFQRQLSSGEKGLSPELLKFLREGV